MSRQGRAKSNVKDKPSSVCLNMIVKNEAPTIKACLESALPFIDMWLVVDTGSTDGTQRIVRDTLNWIPGELVERPWKNFGHNRTEALNLAEGRADYLFFLDADERFVAGTGFAWPAFDADAYDIELRRGAFAYRFPRLVKAGRGWRWRGVVHEYLEAPDDPSHAPLHGAWIASDSSGARSRDPATYKRDALLLEEGLLDEPDNARYAFYLAQSYRDCGDLDLAIRWYERRAEMGGWREEVFESLFQVAACMAKRGDPWPEVQDAYLRAHEAAPHRAEPLFWIAERYMSEQAWNRAWLFLERAYRLPYPENDILFVQRPLYAWRVAMLYAVCAYWIGKHDEAIQVNDTLLRGSTLPKDQAEQVRQNRRYSLEKLGRA